MAHRIEPTQAHHFPGIHAAFGVVAREKRYLAFTEPLLWEPSRQFYEGLLARGCPCFVALEDERVAGWCDIAPVIGDARQHIGVLGIALVPEARHQGLGGRLLRAAIDRAWAVGIKRIELSVRADNHNAAKLYERHGFAHEGVRRKGNFVDGAYCDVISMALLHEDVLPMAAHDPADDYIITSDKRLFDIDAIHSFLSQTFWSPGVPRAVVQKSIEHSLAFGILHRGAQVGFCRVVTDRSTFAYLADVFVLEAHRGKGLSKRLMAAVMAHEDLQGLRRFLLATKDAHGLYAAYGFTPLANPARWMEIWNPQAYLEARE